MNARCEISRQDAGCEQFEVFRSVADPDKLVLLELWKDQAALDAHAKLQAQRPPLSEGLRLGAGEREDYTYNLPAERRGARMQVSYFETGRYYAPSNLPRQWPMPGGLRPRGGLTRLSRHGRAQPVCRATGVRLGQRLRASLFAAHP